MSKEVQESRPCPHDCRKCSMIQHAFCAAQMSYTMSAELEAVRSMVEQLRDDIHMMTDASVLIEPEKK